MSNIQIPGQPPQVMIGLDNGMLGEVLKAQCALSMAKDFHIAKNLSMKDSCLLAFEFIDTFQDAAREYEVKKAAKTPVRLHSV